VRARATGEVFAVKRARRRFRSKAQRERALREVRAVAALPPHANLVAQHRAWQEDGFFFIQMDLCAGGSLAEAAAAAPGGALPERELWAAARDAAAGLAFLHAHGVLHLDVKPANVYRALAPGGAPGAWRVGDFGLAVAREGEDWEEGDGAYVAPELLRPGADPAPAADVFSLGAALYECAAGVALPRRDGSAEAAPAPLPGRPHDLEALLAAMLAPAPGARPTAAEVCAVAEQRLAAAAAAGAGRLDAAAVAGFALETARSGLASHRIPNLSHEAPVGGAAAVPEALPVPGPPMASVRPRLPARWAPQLSPLASTDGSLTPGAAAGLMGLTPPGPSTLGPAAAAAPTPPFGFAPAAPPAARLPPLHLPAAPAGGAPPSARTARTNDGGASFRLRRRDVASPGARGSASESEAFSFSCDTGSASELEFADARSPGFSPRRAGRAVGAAAAPPTAARRARRAAPSLAQDLATSPGLSAAAAAAAATAAAAAAAAPAGGAVRADPRSRESSPGGGGAMSARSYGSVPRFPTLEALARPGSRGAEPSGGAAGAATGGAVVPPLALHGALRRKRHHSSRRALVPYLREGEMASSRSLDLCTSRSVELLMPQKKGARTEGAFHPDDDGGGGEDGLCSGAATQRSVPGSSRLAPPAAAALQAACDNLTLDDAA
jgi:hypothetical protein